MKKQKELYFFILLQKENLLIWKQISQAVKNGHFKQNKVFFTTGL